MKTIPNPYEQLLYTLREIYNMQKSLISEDDTHSFNKENIHKCFLATKTKHPSGVRFSRTIPEKSAVLLFELLHNNLSQTKSRRIAVVTFLMFLYTHGYWLTLPTSEFRSLITWIEVSHPLAQRETILGTSKIILSHLEIIDIEKY